MGAEDWRNAVYENVYENGLPFRGSHRYTGFTDCRRYLTNVYIVCSRTGQVATSIISEAFHDSRLPLNVTGLSPLVMSLN